MRSLPLPRGMSRGILLTSGGEGRELRLAAQYGHDVLRRHDGLTTDRLLRVGAGMAGHQYVFLGQERHSEQVLLARQVESRPVQALPAQRVQDGPLVDELRAARIDQVRSRADPSDP